jgi:hypothetical protein
MEFSGELRAVRARPREQASEAYRRICAWESLLDAHRKAARGKRGHRAPAAFEYRLADQLLALKHDLDGGSYRPGPYVHFHIHEPKRRKISAAPFRDRVLHHALCNVIEPRFERLFIPDSYANRVGKGTHRAVDRLQQFAQRKRPADPPTIFCRIPARLAHLGVWWRWRRGAGRNSGKRMLRRGIEVMRRSGNIARTMDWRRGRFIVGVARRRRRLRRGMQR